MTYLMTTELMTPAERAKIARNKTICSKYALLRAKYGELVPLNRIYKIIEQDMGISSSTIRSVLAHAGYVTITPRS